MFINFLCRQSILYPSMTYKMFLIFWNLHNLKIHQGNATVHLKDFYHSNEDSNLFHSNSPLRPFKYKIVTDLWTFKLKPNIYITNAKAAGEAINSKDKIKLVKGPHLLNANLCKFSSPSVNASANRRDVFVWR